MRAVGGLWLHHMSCSISAQSSLPSAGEAPDGASSGAAQRSERLLPTNRDVYSSTWKAFTELMYLSIPLWYCIIVTNTRIVFSYSSVKPQGERK